MSVLQFTQQQENARSVTRVLGITSGKGGVGKTTVAVNLALSLVGQGKNVLLLDADFGLANVDLLLGVKPHGTLADFFSGEKTLSEIMVSGPSGLSVIPAASGVAELAELTAEQRMMLMDAVESLPTRYDYLIIDTPAGIGADVMHLVSASGDVMVIINPEPTSLTDAYALVKVLCQDYGEQRISVIVNDVRSEEEGRTAFRTLSHALERFLHVEARYLGCIPTDNAVVEAVQSQTALVELYPSAKASLAIKRLASLIDESGSAVRIKGGVQFFFRQLLEVAAHG